MADSRTDRSSCYCPVCGSVPGFPCYDRRYRIASHLTPVPVRRFHRERTVPFTKTGMLHECGRIIGEPTHV